MFLLDHEFIKQILTKDFICDAKLDNESNDLQQDIEGSLYPLKSGLRLHTKYKSTCHKNKSKMGTYDKGSKTIDIPKGR